MKRRIPKTVWLDENYSVSVKFEPPSMIEARYGKPGKGGFYDGDAMTIHIDKTISKARKWRTFRHEIIHAAIDIDMEVNGGV